MPRFWKVVRGKRDNEAHRLQQYRYYEYGNNNSHNTNITSIKKCANCKHKMLCALHATNGKTQSTREEDEERLYIHKTVSIEMMSQKPNVVPAV